MHHVTHFDPSQLAGGPYIYPTAPVGPYVYPTQPYTVYLCSVFWTAPLTGTDSQGGTLIHESSHFNTVASTDDWTYGQTNCRSLAISDPDKAIDNADSHEYYAENNPVQK